MTRSLLLLVIAFTLISLTLLATEAAAHITESNQSLRVVLHRTRSSLNTTATSDYSEVTLRNGLRNNKKRGRRNEEPVVVPLHWGGGGRPESSRLLGEIMVGTPAVAYRVIFDTGSTTVWLFGERAKTSIKATEELAGVSMPNPSSREESDDSDDGDDSSSSDGGTTITDYSSDGGATITDNSSDDYDASSEHDPILTADGNSVGSSSDSDNSDDISGDATGSSCGGKFVHTYYNQLNSRSYKPWYGHNGHPPSQHGIQEPLAMHSPYEDNDSVEGTFASETLQIGNLRFEHTPVGIADTITCSTGKTANDGIFGLGIDSSNDQHALTPLFVRMAGTLGQHRLFSLYFSSDAQHGELIFGGVNEYLFTGTLSYVPRASKIKTGGEEEEWAVAIDLVTFGNTELFRRDAATVDTGTSVIVVPPDAMSAIVTNIERHIGRSMVVGQALHWYTFQGCRKVVNELPALQFTIAGEVYTIRASEYFVVGDNGDCDLQVIGRDYPFLILGEPFLKTYYTVFDYGKDKIGFARAVHNNKGAAGNKRHKAG